jgi:hypothetical protein
MDPLNRERFLRVLGLSSDQFDYWGARDHVAMAWGRSRPKRFNAYEPLDLFAMGLCQALSGLLDRKAAAAVVRNFWALWIDALRRIEAGGPDAPREIFFVGLRETDAEPVLSVSAGTLPEIARDLKELPLDEAPTIGAQTDLRVIDAAIREMARRAAVELPEKFFDMDERLFAAMVAEDNRRRLREPELRRPREKSRGSKHRAAPIMRDLARRDTMQ